MAELKKSFEKRTLFGDYAGKEYSDWDWDASFFESKNPKEARLMFFARGYQPPTELFEGLHQAGFEFEAMSYPETDFFYTTQEPLDDFDEPCVDIRDLASGVFSFEDWFRPDEKPCQESHG